MSKQIDLLFGVKGGGSASGTSGQHIKSQLDNIVGQINKTPFKIVFEANTDAIKTAQEQINALKKSIEQGFNINIKTANYASEPSSAYNSSKQGTLSVAQQEDLAWKEYEKEKKELSMMHAQRIAQIDKEAQAIEIATQREIAAYKAVERQKDAVFDKNAANASVAHLEEVIAAQEERMWADYENKQKRDREATEAKANSDYNAYLNKVKQAEQREAEIVEAATKREIAAYERVEDAKEKALYDNAENRLNQDMTEKLSKEKLLNRVLKSYDSFQNIKDYPELNQRYTDMIKQLSAATNLGTEDSKHFAAQLNRLENDAYKAGVACDTLGEAIEKKIGDRLKYLVGQFAINFVTQGLRMIYDNVVQIDSAMTELKKVTDATSQEYERFLSNASVRAKELGASLVEVINATADYARLGYSLSEASALADSAIVYQNVGDGLSGIDEATQHLISTMAAFGVAAEDSMHIVDIFNEVANNYAVSASDIGTGLQRSAAAMKAAGNSLEETVAIFTAANTIRQDADVVGRNLPTLKVAISVKPQRWARPRKDLQGIRQVS